MSEIPPNAIFVNYRKADTEENTRFLVRELRSRFGDRAVFADYHSLPLGQSYPATIRSQLSRAKVMVTVIGEQWLSSDDTGARLIDRDGDWVRREIEVAFEQGIPVIPVLVNGADRPAADDLPRSIRALATRQSLDLYGANVDAGLDRLIAALEDIVEPEPPVGPAVGAKSVDPPAARRPGRRFVIVLCAVALLLAAGGVALWRGPLAADRHESLPPARTSLPPTHAPSRTAARPPSPSTKPPAATPPTRTRSAPPSPTVAPPSTAPRAAPVFSGRYRLYNPETGFCLGERLPRASDGSILYGYTQEGCAQAHTLTITGGPGNYRLADPLRSDCVGLTALRKDEAVIGPVDCDSEPAAAVEWALVGTSTVTMISRTDRTRCMSAKAVKSGLAFLRMYPCGGDKAPLQQWTLRTVR